MIVVHDIDTVVGLDILKLSSVSESADGRILIGVNKYNHITKLLTDPHFVSDEVTTTTIRTMLGVSRQQIKQALNEIGIRWEYLLARIPNDPSNQCRKEIERWRSQVKAGAIKFAIRANSNI